MVLPYLEDAADEQINTSAADTRYSRRALKHDRLVLDIGQGGIQRFDQRDMLRRLVAPRLEKRSQFW